MQGVLFGNAAAWIIHGPLSNFSYILLQKTQMHFLDTLNPVY